MMEYEGISMPDVLTQQSIKSCECLPEESPNAKKFKLKALAAPEICKTSWC